MSIILPSSPLLNARSDISAAVNYYSQFQTIIFESKNCKVYDTSKCTIDGKVQVTATKIDSLYRLDKQLSELQVPTSSTKLTSEEKKNSSNRGTLKKTKKKLYYFKETIDLSLKFRKIQNFIIYCWLCGRRLGKK